MTYFSDLSKYTYGHAFFGRAGTKNIGWLDNTHEFIRQEPSEALLQRVWEYCRVSVAQTRGFHKCEICMDADSCLTERNGERLLLGTAEIRVFGKNGDIYAAPTLIYHYMKVHHYMPPAVFVQALFDGALPSDQEYLKRLEELGLEWRKTSAPTSP